MKKAIELLFILLFTTLIVSCGEKPQQTAKDPMLQPTSSWINPGDRIGDFLVTTGEVGKAQYAFDCFRKLSNQGEREDFLSYTYVAEQINPTTGIFESDILRTIPSLNLERLWSDFHYELTVDGHPVNLQAFGTIDVQLPSQCLMRFWNVVIIAERSGSLTVHDSGLVDGIPFENSMTLKFLSP